MQCMHRVWGRSTSVTKLPRPLNQMDGPQTITHVQMLRSAIRLAEPGQPARRVQPMEVTLTSSTVVALSDALLCWNI